MNYWLIKSEPFVYSFAQLQKDGKGRWDGVRNFAARNHLRAMKLGDELLFYHSNEGLAVVGIAKVVGEHYPDPTYLPEPGERKAEWSAVDVAPVRLLNRPVSLAEIKKTDELSEMALLKLGRLSVSPVSEKEFLKILEMSETAAPGN